MQDKSAARRKFGHCGLFSFILQDAAQGFHWNNSQATLHPFVAYFVDSGELCHPSYVIISDCLQHDTIAVYLFQKCFIAFLKNLLPERLQPKYFSDDAASQHKNRKKTLSICVSTRIILAYQLSGIFLLPHTEKGLVTV